MAILDEVPGIKVTIQVGGQEATEYIDPHASESNNPDDPECPIVLRYIESIDDAEFSVKVDVDDDVYAWDDTNHVLSISVQIDGQPVSGSFCERGMKSGVMKGENFYSADSQEWYIRNLKFSAISIVDDRTKKRIQRDMETVERVGLIEVTIERHVLQHEVSAKPGESANPGALELGEKALKRNFISHSTSYGKNEAIEAPKLYDACRLPMDDGPIAVFRFMYRSKESLKAQLIIPRTPEPEPTGSSTSLSVDDLTMAEVRRLAQEKLDEMNWAREAKGRSTSITKREISGVVDIDEEDKKARSRKRRVVTIDLTDD
ncbi:hypothetical protein F4678DRAFT_461234 [Xylaria arbuscula]|nr:hypothetical protein F4678DRAFT_461234 [Xylaria arbuscula]